MNRTAVLQDFVRNRYPFLEELLVLELAQLLTDRKFDSPEDLLSLIQSKVFLGRVGEEAHIRRVVRSAVLNGLNQG